MYNFNGFAPNISFFGACNSFNGFKSHFPQIFDPQKFTRIFILKGGPGTGKSSLMRSVGAYYARLGLYTEAIYCSSDPTSLDGIIVKRSGQCIAIIDGTSPHATEARYPGLIEKTTNLENSINSSILSGSRDRILELNRKKSEGYRNGYLALSGCGEIFKIIKAELSVFSRNIAAELSAKYGFKECNQHKNTTTPTIRIESSFSKFGANSLNRNDENKTVISVGTTPLMGGIILHTLYTNYLCGDSNLTICPSPLSSDLIDRIYTKDYIFETSFGSYPTIEIDSMLPYTDRLSDAIECYNKALELARSMFSYASDMHFALEDIYKRSMDFENNERIHDEIIKEMNTLLGI